MKWLIFLVLFTFAAFDVAAQVSRLTSADGREQCEKSQGVWRQFGNGCADSCSAKFNEFAVCTETIILACDCGKGKCWNDDSCVSLSEYQAIYNREQEKENKVLDAARQKRLSRFKQNRKQIMDGFAKQVPPSSDSNGNPNNNLSSFYKKNVVVNQRPTEVAQQQQPTQYQSPDQPANNNKNNKEGGFFSFFGGDDSATNNNPPAATPANPYSAVIAPEIPPSFLEQEAKQKAATATADKQQVTTTTAAPAATDTTQNPATATAPKVGFAPTTLNSLDPNRKLIPSKSLLGGSPAPAVGQQGDAGLPQLSPP